MAAQALLEASSPRDQARLLEQANSVGSAFMAVTPSPATNTIISTDTYRLGLRWWLGVPILIGDPLPSCAGCQAPLDPFGDHLLCCPRNNFAERHNSVQDAFLSLLQAAGQGVQREQAVPGSDARELRPADLLLRHWQGGQDTAVDFTVVHGWQAAEARHVSRERWRSFLARKETAKKEKYTEACTKAHWAFIPAAFGTWGGQGPDAARLLHQVSKRVAGWVEGEERASEQETARHRVGLAVMRGVWALLEKKAFVPTPLAWR